MVLSGCLYQAAHSSHDKGLGICIPWWRHQDREQRHHCPRDITWHVVRVGGSGHFHLLLYSTYRMILIKYVHSKPLPICSKFIDNQDDDSCINSVASAFLLLPLFQPYFHLLQAPKRSICHTKQGNLEVENEMLICK